MSALYCPAVTAGAMERAARNHGEESLSSVTRRLPLPCVKIDNRWNLMGSSETETEKTEADKKVQERREKKKLALQIMSFL